MTNIVAKLLFSIALAIASLASPVEAQTAAQWNYSFVGNNAQASYPGQVAIPALGTAGCLGTSSGVLVTCAKSGGANPLDYGAVANDNTKAAINVAAFQAAMAANNALYCPDNVTFYVGAITIPTNVTSFTGGCNLIAAGTIATNAYLLLASTNTAGLIISGPHITISNATYPTVAAIFMSASNNWSIQNVTTNGGLYGITFNGDTNFSVVNNTVLNYGGRGIFGGVTDDQFVIANNTVNNARLGSHCVSVSGGTNFTIANNTLNQCGYFGVDVESHAGAPSLYYAVTGNIINGAVHECIANTDSQYFTITGNACYFDVNSQDFGITTYATTAGRTMGDGIISNNIIYAPCKAAIDVNMAAGTSTRFNVTGNYIYNANNCNDATNNGLADIVVVNTTTYTNVADNMFVNSNGFIKYQIAEVGATPDHNFLSGGAGNVGTLGQILSSGPNTQVFNSYNAWIAYTPTITCGTGSIGSQTATGSYKLQGKVVEVQVDDTLTTVGTCAAPVFITMPVAAGANGTISGREITTGQMTTGSLSTGATGAQVALYNNGSILIAGFHLRFNGSYVGL